MNVYRAASRALYERVDDSYFCRTKVEPVLAILERFARRAPKYLHDVPAWGTTERWAYMDHQIEFSRWVTEYPAHATAIETALIEWIRTDRASLAGHQKVLD